MSTHRQGVVGFAESGSRRIVMKMKRLFLAISIPEVLKEEIYKRLNTLNLSLKWIPEKNLHVKSVYQKPPVFAGGFFVTI